MKNGEQTFPAEILFIDWLQTQFIPRNDQPGIRGHHNELTIILVDAGSSHITPHIFTHADSQELIVLRLGPHSFHTSRPLDLCVFSLFKIL
jgi:hypothetical protein